MLNLIICVMKKSFLLLAMLCVSAFTFAQVKFKLDAGVHGGFSFGDVKMYGIGASLEPKVFLTPKLSAGARFEGTALFGGNIDASGESVSASASSVAAFLAKGEYYTKDEGTRPFFGLGVGYYTIGSNSAGTSGATVSAGSHFGVAPQIGITFNNFRLSGIYHVVTGKDMLTISAGDPQEISRNYLVVELGFKIFGSNK
jgi:hypothetical protein